VTMAPRLRKFVLTTHVAASVGWLGAVVVFLALAVIGVTGQDAQLVRAAYLAAEPVTGFVIVPLALVSLVTGVFQSLGTQWGLFRHYWVLFKLLLNVIATIVLLMYMETVRYFADIAAESSTDLAELRRRLSCPLEWRPAAVAYGYGAGGVQAAGHDPLRAA
jgi:uncharacterized membrane protein